MENPATNPDHDAEPPDRHGQQQPDSIWLSRLLLTVIVCVSLGGALWGWIFHINNHRLPIKLWGADRANWIVSAERVSIMHLVPRDLPEIEPASLTKSTWDQETDPRRKQEITKLPALTFLRKTLVDGRSFDWNADPDSCEPPWSHAIRFESEEGEFTVLVAVNCGCVKALDRPETARLGTGARPVMDLLAEIFP